jgi:hypothetical protein
MVTGDSLILSGVLEAETTMSSNFVSSICITTSTLLESEVTCSFCEANPILETSIVNGSLAVAFNTNFPVASVVVPKDCPEILTFTPGIGSFLLSFTEPEIELCAKIYIKNNIIECQNKIINLH